MNGEEVVDGGAGAADEVARLREALAFERMKNQVLVEQLIGLEDKVAETDAKAYADVIPDEDREYWMGQLVTNREAAVGFLERLRNRFAPAAVDPAPEAKPGAAPAAAPAPAAAVPPKPLHNRAAKPAVAEAEPARGGGSIARCTRIANRSRELVRSHGISFDAAWRRAEAELGE